MSVVRATPALPRAASLAVAVLLASLALALFGGVLLQPIRDYDFFWHLRTGDWIREHRALPGEFLFSITATPPMTEAQRFTMTSYWLAQVVSSLLYAAGGLTAIAVLRGLLLALYVFLLRLRTAGDDLVFLGLLAPAIITMGGFPLERPQVYSFVFLGVLLWLLEGFRTTASRNALLARGAAVPVLMAVWANTHGAFVIGMGILVLFLLAESAKRLHPGLHPLPPERYRLVPGFCAAGLLASLLNPTSFLVIEMALRPLWARGAEGLVWSANQEYQSTLSISRMGGNPELLPFWFLLALAAVALLLSWRKPDLWHIALVAVVGYFSFTGLRYVPFFAIAALPVIAGALSREGVLGPARVFVALAAVGWGLLFLPVTVRGYREAERTVQVDAARFPVAAADFIEQAGLRGNMFADYGWGGYLLWRLPSVATFVDGRNSDPALLDTYLKVLGADRSPVDGQPFWKSVLARYRIRSVVLPVYNPVDGEVFPLVDALLADPAWQPVYATGTALVFVADTPEHRESLSRFLLPKGDFRNRLIGALELQIRAAPYDVRAYVAQGDLLQQDNRYPEALLAYRRALRLAPQHPLARVRVAELRNRGFN